jgi:hypothetical protein
VKARDPTRRDGCLTISNGARRDRLFQAGAVLEIFDPFRAGRGHRG